MNQRTILELAEELRAHLNTDNDAKRLIIEHVLPLLGISKDTLQHAEQIETLKKTLNSTRRELESILNDLDDCE